MRSIAFWEAKLYQALTQVFKNDDLTQLVPRLLFVIQLDESERQPNQTTYDDIMRLMVLPQQVNQEKTLSQVLEILVSVNNEFPLFVKIATAVPLTALPKVILTISKRFRRWKDIETWHQGQALAPFIITAAG
ncbi:hypothetical protein MTX78_14865 [Hymenobacter tibetensis]|uniref:Uncharacterized protein n=1 Tax=Hymenobacter tibetensis TaxID=497967 RepID=A0ABY4CWM2_9BACT|nr:hypothetical protein [Hymenobacter tibetensis]UOG73406.1 hypothetical protein MTX78_14865 [Hymenobacter tibetensis]